MLSELAAVDEVRRRTLARAVATDEDADLARDDAKGRRERPRARRPRGRAAPRLVRPSPHSEDAALDLSPTAREPSQSYQCPMPCPVVAET